MATILLVDDSTTIRNMLKATLEPAGYRILEASGGRAGLEVVKQEPLDLIISDQNMPGLDGLGMVKAIRAGSSNQNVPILVLTTETSDAMKAAFRTTRVEAGEFIMAFKFRDIEDMDRADDEWRAAMAIDTPAKVSPCAGYAAQQEADEAGGA